MSQGKQMYYHYLRENIRNMHPKFKALAIQAGAYEDGGTILTGPMDVAKFAELIVRECMNVARQQRNPANLNYKPSERFVEDLRQHFGVEQ